jgi:hypothetical protein
VRHPRLERYAASIIAAGNGDDDDMMTSSAVAEWLQVSKQWLEIGRCKGHGPKFIRLSSQVVRYRRGDVKSWLADRQYAHTAEYTD